MILPRIRSYTEFSGAVGDGFDETADCSLPREGYRIEASENGVHIDYADDAGRFYAHNTLEALRYGSDLPRFKAEDYPEYSYRGFMIDCSRHFFTAEELKKQIDVAANLKLNKFHWHLTDDQGWRMSSDKYPLLTIKGAQRRYKGQHGVRSCGFYAKEDMREIVAYCAERFIEVIPEIDMPGHFTAAIAAYPYLGCKEVKDVDTKIGIHKDIACFGEERTLEFLKDVIAEAAEIFPSEYIHLGGDEAPKNNWAKCARCRAAADARGLRSVRELQGAVMTELVAYAADLGKKVIMWNDGIDGVEGDFTVHFWKQSSKGVNAVKKACERGASVIISPFSHYYLDYPAGITPMKKTYAYEAPDFVKRNALGAEAPLWTEFVKSEERLEELLYPRLIAFADRAWAGKGDYGEFLEALKGYEAFLQSRAKLNFAARPDPKPTERIAEALKFLRFIARGRVD